MSSQLGGQIGNDIVAQFPPVPPPSGGALVYWDPVTKKYIDIGIGSGLSVIGGNLTASSGSGTIGGSIDNHQIAFGSGTNTIQGTISATLDTSGNSTFNSVSANAVTLNGPVGQVQVLLGSDTTAYYAEDSLGTRLLDIGGGYDSQDAHAYFGAPFQVATIPNNDASDQISFIVGYVAAAYSALTITQSADFGNGSGSVTYFMPDSNHGLKVIAGAPMEYFSSDPMQFDTSFGGSPGGGIYLNCVDGLGAGVFAGLQTIDDGTGTGIMQNLNIPGELFIGGSGFLSMSDGAFVAFGSSTGNKLGTTTSQKIAFWNATPIVQPANTVAIDTLLVNTGLRASGGVAGFDTDIKINTVGKGYYVKEGTNASAGTAVLSAGLATVSTTKITANSRVILTIQTPGGTVGSPYVNTRTAGTSFQIKSTSLSDTSTVFWEIREPN